VLVALAALADDLFRLFIIQILDPLLAPAVKLNPITLHLDINADEVVAAKAVRVAVSGRDAAR